MRPAWEWVRRHPRQVVYVILGCLIGYWVLRGCVPGLGGGLPGAVDDAIRRQYTVCVTDTAIMPGEPRQPSCGQVTIVVSGTGAVPAEQHAEGVTRAVCYKATITTPQWTTLGTTRHEIGWSARIASKVAVLQNGAWQIFPDREDLDEARWTQYSCPASYESQALPYSGG